MLDDHTDASSPSYPVHHWASPTLRAVSVWLMCFHTHLQRGWYCGRHQNYIHIWLPASWFLLSAKCIFVSKCMYIVTKMWQWDEGDDIWIINVGLYRCIGRMMYVCSHSSTVRRSFWKEKTWVGLQRGGDPRLTSSSTYSVSGLRRNLPYIYGESLVPVFRGTALKRAN